MKNKIIIAVLLIFSIFLLGCGTSEEIDEKQVTSGIKDVTLTTSDNINIASTYFYNTGDKSVILLHMLGQDRSTYTDFALQLQANGYSVLAIDFRGHGESDLDYLEFSSNDWQNLKLDVKAAKEYLVNNNKNTVSIVGASIGANAALIFAAEDMNVLGLVLLSPGEEYQSVNVMSAASIYSRPVYLAAGLADSYSAISTTKIYNELSGQKEIKMYDSDKHGTDLLGSELNMLIVGWLDRLG